MVFPDNGTLVSTTHVHPYEIKVAAIVQQIDPDLPAALKTKSSWDTTALD